MRVPGLLPSLLAALAVPSTAWTASARAIFDHASGVVREKSPFDSLQWMKKESAAKFDPETEAYDRRVEKSVAAVWRSKFPRGFPQYLGGNGRGAIFEVIIRDDGSLYSVRLVSSSGNAIFDEEAINSIYEAAPFEEPPHRYSGIILYRVRDGEFEMPPRLR